MPFVTSLTSMPLSTRDFFWEDCPKFIPIDLFLDGEIYISSFLNVVGVWERVLEIIASFLWLVECKFWLPKKILCAKHRLSKDHNTNALHPITKYFSLTRTHYMSKRGQMLRLENFIHRCTTKQHSSIFATIF